MNITHEFSPDNQMLCILKGVGVGLASAVIMMGLGALIITYSEISENAIPVVVKIITFVSLFICGYGATRKSKRHGLLRGMTAAIVYFVLLYLISLLLGQSAAFSAGSFIFLLLGTIVSGIGGIMGVNRRQKK